MVIRLYTCQIESYRPKVENRLSVCIFVENRHCVTTGASWYGKACNKFPRHQSTRASWFLERKILLTKKIAEIEEYYFKLTRVEADKFTITTKKAIRFGTRASPLASLRKERQIEINALRKLSTLKNVSPFSVSTNFLSVQQSRPPFEITNSN